MGITIKNGEDLKEVLKIVSAFDNSTTSYPLSLRYDVADKRYEVIDRTQRRLSVDEKGDLVITAPRVRHRNQYELWVKAE